jgi:hypothetical protein
VWCPGESGLSRIPTGSLSDSEDKTVSISATPHQPECKLMN